MPLIQRTWQTVQFEVFKPLSYCFEETIGFDVYKGLVCKASTVTSHQTR